MRLAGVFVAFAGLVLLVVGLFSGCGSLFSWNGRHVIEVQTLAPGTPHSHVLHPVPGRRYSAAVEVAFDRTSLPPQEGGVPVVSAKMPISARVVDARGGTVAETTGWIDPEEPPTVLYGAHPSPREGARAELVAERLVGHFPAVDRGPFDVRVELGPDRVGTARISEARLVLYDDVTPPAIKRALGAAAAGGAGFVAGVVLVLVGSFRGRARRGGIRGR